MATVRPRLRAALAAAAALAATTAVCAEQLKLPAPPGRAPSFDTLSSAPAAGITLPSAMTADPLVPGSSHERSASPDGDLAFGAFQRGYFATALSEAMKRLRSNPKDGAAMALIGEIYSQGLAVRPNPVEAAKWDKLGSEQGNREATFSYAMALLQGTGVDKDRSAAHALFEKAAAQGHAGALYNLGVMAIQGDGKTHGFVQGATFFQRAAEAGDIDALFALATLAQSGRGMPADPVRAAALMKQAADAKHVGAEVEYGIMLFNGQGVDRNEAEAAHYFKLAAIQGNPIAENRLARLYAAGRGVAKDPVEAARWHILARAAGIADAWLDGQLTAMSPADKAKVEDIVRRQIGP